MVLKKRNIVPEHNIPFQVGLQHILCKLNFINSTWLRTTITVSPPQAWWSQWESPCIAIFFLKKRVFEQVLKLKSDSLWFKRGTLYLSTNARCHGNAQISKPFTLLRLTLSAKKKRRKKNLWDNPCICLHGWLSLTAKCSFHTFCSRCIQLDVSCAWLVLMVSHLSFQSLNVLLDCFHHQ